MLTKHLCVLIHTRIKGGVGTGFLLRYSVACTYDSFSFYIPCLYVLRNDTFTYLCVLIHIRIKDEVSAI